MHSVNGYGSDWRSIVVDLLSDQDHIQLPDEPSDELLVHLLKSVIADSSLVTQCVAGAWHDELYDAYHSLADVILDDYGNQDEDTYEMGYLDAWADALDHAGFAGSNEHLTKQDCFELFASTVREQAVEGLLKQRTKRWERKS